MSTVSAVWYVVSDTKMQTESDFWHLEGRPSIQTLFCFFGLESMRRTVITEYIIKMLVEGQIV